MHNEAWTPDIDALATSLRRERLPAKAIAARIGRTPGAVSARLLKLGVTIHGRTEWEAADVERLRALVDGSDMPIRDVARLLDRTECSVRWKIDDLGLVPGRLRAWTKADDARVLAAAGKPDEALRALADEIGRTYDALRARLVHLGVRRKATWDRATVARLRAFVADGASLEDTAVGLAREPGAVRSKAYALGLRFPDARATPVTWDDQADSALRLAAARHGVGSAGVARAADATGRPERAVKARMRELGMTQPRRRRPLDEAGKAEILAAAAAGTRLTVAMRELGRDARTLRDVAAAAGVAFRVAERTHRPSSLPQGNLSVRVMVPGVAARPGDAARLPDGRPARAPYRPVAPRPGADRFGMGDAIARFIREKGVTRDTADPVGEAVRRIRARGYAVVRSDEGGFLIDGRVPLPDERGLFSFAAARGIEVPEATA